MALSSDPNAASRSRDDGDAEVEDEILILGGKTKLVEQGVGLGQGHLSKPSTPTISTSMSTPSSSSISRSQTLVPDAQAIYQTLHTPTTSSSNSTQLEIPDALNLLPSLPPPPRPEDIPMNTAMATAFEHTSLPSAWSDQEALLIKYLSSGVDLNVAQSSVYASDPDPAAFMWADMSYSNSPDSQPSMDANSTGTGASGASNTGNVAGNGYSQQQQDGNGAGGDVIRSQAATPFDTSRSHSQAQTPYSVGTNLNLDLDTNSAAFPLFSMNGTGVGYPGVVNQQQHLNQQQQQQQPPAQQPYSVPVQLGGLSWNPQWSDPQVFF